MSDHAKLIEELLAVERLLRDENGLPGMADTCRLAADALEAECRARAEEYAIGKQIRDEHHAALQRVWKVLGYPPKTYADAAGKDIAELVAALTEALAAKEQAEAYADEVEKRCSIAGAQLGMAQAEVARLTAALAFYAARETWKGDDPPIRQDCDGDFVATPGLKARLALSLPTTEPGKAEENDVAQ